MMDQWSCKKQRSCEIEERIEIGIGIGIETGTGTGTVRKTEIEIVLAAGVRGGEGRD
jgi:hypothetical protein